MMAQSRSARCVGFQVQYDDDDSGDDGAGRWTLMHANCKSRCLHFCQAELVHNATKWVDCIQTSKKQNSVTGESEAKKLNLMLRFCT